MMSDREGMVTQRLKSVKSVLSTVTGKLLHKMKIKINKLPRVLDSSKNRKLYTQHEKTSGFTNGFN